MLGKLKKSSEKHQLIYSASVSAPDFSQELFFHNEPLNYWRLSAKDLQLILIRVTRFSDFNLWKYKETVIPFNIRAPPISEYEVYIHKHLDFYFLQTVLPQGCASTAILFSRSFSENRQCQLSLTCWQWEQKRGSTANNSIHSSTLLGAAHQILHQLSRALSAYCSCLFESVFWGFLDVLIDVNHHSYEFWILEWTSFRH